MLARAGAPRPKLRQQRRKRKTAESSCASVQQEQRRDKEDGWGRRQAPIISSQASHYVSGASEGPGPSSTLKWKNQEGEGPLASASGGNLSFLTGKRALVTVPGGRQRAGPKTGLELGWSRVGPKTRRLWLDVDVCPRLPINEQEFVVPTEETWIPELPTSAGICWDLQTSAGICWDRTPVHPPGRSCSEDTPSSAAVFIRATFASVAQFCHVCSTFSRSDR